MSASSRKVEESVACDAATMEHVEAADTDGKRNDSVLRGRGG